MKQPKVTICMPVFNGGHYFRAALESALAQDYENLEILVVNDGSTDGGETEYIALTYGDRIRYVWQQNRGVGGALNTAIDRMTGEYFAWLSHDDIHLPNKTSAQIAFLHRLGRPRACLFSDYELIGPEGDSITTVRLPVGRIRRNPRLPLFNGLINGCTILVPAEIMREFAPFDENRRCTQDYDFWNRVLTHHEFFHQPEVLVRYRVHPGQGTHTSQAVNEGDVLWQEMLDSRNEVERAQMFGSGRRYFSYLASFLENTPYKKAASYARSRAKESSQLTLVSVIIPFFNEIELTLRSARSVFMQTHENVELLLVNDGSTEDVSPLEELAAQDPRVRLLHQRNSGPGAARNAGLMYMRGDYVAFLDADDRFLPYKIERQLGQMQEHGALFSHTSYYVAFPGQMNGLGIWRSGKLGGNCYPQVIGSCSIAMPTVMLHRALVDEGFAFPIVARTGEDVIAWINLAQRCQLLGLDEPLSVVEWSHTSAALDIFKQIIMLGALVDALERDPAHRMHIEEIGKLRAALRSIARNWNKSSLMFDEVNNVDAMIREACQPVFNFKNEHGGRNL